ncbi:MAG: HAD-IIIA family hydrolase [Candidatus Falkowbacteria bacterium]|nr:HAD-IIIA family hydrolase [Candidatus Falkowbacteria bacterium]
MQALILAGGKGTRLGNLTKRIPKPLVKIVGKPVLEYQIELLAKNKIRDITILTNYLGDKIKKFCGNGGKWHVKINYLEESPPLGTAGGVKELESHLRGNFLVIYGDLLLNIDFARFEKQHNKNKTADKQCAGTLMVHPNDHPYDSDLVDVNEDHKITRFICKPHPHDLVYNNLVNAAVYIFSTKIFHYIPKGVSSDFGKDIFPQILNVNKHSLYAYNSPEYLKDMGTPERLRQASNDVKKDLYNKRTLKYKNPAVFLDRDGVINEEVDHLTSVDNFKLIKNADKAIKKLNENGFYAVVITNQSAIAKGFCSYEDVLNINKKMQTELGKNGARLDRILFCPHHPEKGFPGENKKYKTKCNCRKPKLGMLKKAIKELNIDQKKSYFIGDSTTDALTAKKAGIPFIGVKTGYGCRDKKYLLLLGNKAINIQRDIYSAVVSIVKRKI